MEFWKMIVVDDRKMMTQYDRIMYIYIYVYLLFDPWSRELIAAQLNPVLKRA